MQTRPHPGGSALLLPRPLPLILASLLCGCAALPPGERDASDRFERGNRAVYRFNDSLDRHVATPMARTYIKVTPRPIRDGIGNFFRNLTYPTVIVNDLLQVKAKAFVTDTARLVVNTVFGIGGLFDPATQMGLKSGDEDFGQTLGRWGVPAGPYMMLPVLGPSTVRDVFGLGADHFTYPVTYVNNTPVALSLTAVELLDNRAELLPTTDVLADTYDPYAFIRNAYLQRRQYQVKDGATTDEEVEIFEDDKVAPATEPAAEPVAEPAATN
jgi:phospholipid-binding lipoprotein MlaA